VLRRLPAGEGARAPSTNRLVPEFGSTFGKATQSDYLITRAVITRINAVSLNPAVPTITFSPSRIFTSL